MTLLIDISNLDEPFAANSKDTHVVLCLDPNPARLYVRVGHDYPAEVVNNEHLLIVDRVPPTTVMSSVYRWARASSVQLLALADRYRDYLATKLGNDSFKDVVDSLEVLLAKLSDSFEEATLVVDSASNYFRHGFSIDAEWAIVRHALGPSSRWPEIAAREIANAQLNGQLIHEEDLLDWAQSWYHEDYLPREWRSLVWTSPPDACSDVTFAVEKVCPCDISPAGNWCWAKEVQPDGAIDFVLLGRIRDSELADWNPQVHVPAEYTRIQDRKA